jgi:uncharacterized protein
VIAFNQAGKGGLCREICRGSHRQQIDIAARYVKVFAMASDRFQSLDTLRGFAVMGIVVMNIIAFAMPEAAYLNPVAYGPESLANTVSWSLAFLLFDNKMRGLFSILFGASMFLVYTRAEAVAGNGIPVHLRRMAVLLGFGILHFYLLWEGDILILYALCGIIASAFLETDDASLRRLAAILFGVGFLLLAGNALSLQWTSWVAHQPAASAAQLADWRELSAEIGRADPSKLAETLAVHRGPYWGVVTDRMMENAAGPIRLFGSFAPETVGLMVVGILLFRNGFLTGGWTLARYQRVAVVAYLLGLPALFLELIWCWVRGFDAVTVVGVGIAWSLPFRLAVTIGHAALALIIFKRFGETRALARVASVGRMAFSNYLGTSLILTPVFTGASGWYGHLERWQAYALCVPIWMIMLAWSKPWLDHYRYGPLEWLWRSLARGEAQPMRR